MNTLLQIRPLSVRLRIAYMATKDKTLVPCDPGNTFSRLNSFDSGRFRHPYMRMWSQINEYYNRNGFGSKSDQAINEMFASQLATDESLRKCVDRWTELGWKEYEQRRDGRRQGVRKYALPAIIIGAAFCGADLSDMEA